MIRKSYIFILFIQLGALSRLQAQNFSDISSSLGIQHTYGIGSAGGGVSFVDFNNDGWDDITFATQKGAAIHFYINNKNETFDKVNLIGVDNILQAKHVLWVDYDNDGDQDLYVSSMSLNILYENIGDLHFVDVTEVAGLTLQEFPSFGIAWGDYNRDGWVDLYVSNKQTITNTNNTNYLYMNNGDGTFDDVSVQMNVQDAFKKPFCAGFLDYNNDLWPDIYLVQDRDSGNTLLKNTEGTAFEDVSSTSGAGVEMDGMSLTYADYNKDGLLDIYVSNTSEGNKLFQNNGDESFKEVADLVGLSFNSVAWGANFIDCDNDADLDLYVSGSLHGTQNLSSAFYENNEGIYSIPNDIGFARDTAISFSNSIGDYNNDGLLDVVVNNHAPYESFVWKNTTTSGKNWTKIHLVGDLSNRDGIGSWIEVFTDGEKQVHYTSCGFGYLGQNTRNIHFGVNNTTVIDSIKVKWTSGVVDVIKEVAVNQIIEIHEGAGDLIPEIYYVKNTICSGDSVFINTGRFYDSYLWSNGETGYGIWVKEGGEYDVKIVKDGNEAFSEKLTITIMESLVVDSDIRDVSCYNGSDGSIAINISGGELPYRYVWSQQDASLQVFDKKAGTYDIYVQDNLACNQEAYLTIKEPDEMLILFDLITKDQSKYDIEATVIGGTPPYTYLWDDDLAQETLTASNLVSGVYSLSILDDNGCSTMESINIDAILAIENIEVSAIDVYPNPVNQFLTIKGLLDRVSVKIMDSRGALVEEYTLDATENIHINFSDYKPGLYFIKMRKKDGSYTINRLLKK